MHRLGQNVGVPPENLNPQILMVKAPEDGQSEHLANRHSRPEVRRILVQCEVCAYLIVIRRVGFQGAAQMCLAEHDDVIEAFPAD